MHVGRESTLCLDEEVRIKYDNITNFNLTSNITQTILYQCSPLFQYFPVPPAIALEYQKTLELKDGLVPTGLKDDISDWFWFHFTRKTII